MNKETIEEAAKQPPIGLMPKWRWDELRLEAIKEAIERFKENGREIPLEWGNEIKALSKEAEGMPKKKLEEITDEEAIEVAKMCQSPLESHLLQIGKDIIKAFISNEDRCYIGPLRLLRMAQYLEYKGYDLPKYYPSPELTQKVEDHREQWISVESEKPTLGSRIMYFDNDIYHGFYDEMG